MKKIKILVIALLALLIIPISVNAASGTVSVSGSSTAVEGNRLTVTVNLSSSTAMGSWQMDLNYDRNYLELLSSSAEAGGTTMAGYSASGTRSKSYTFTFRAKKSGTTRVSVSSYLAYSYSDISDIKLTSSAKTIKIITQKALESSYSKDNNLKSLSVEGYELDKPFSSSTLDYSVNVPTGTKSINIIAQKNDSSATVSGTGEKEVNEGINAFAIVVKAQNGAEKTYNLTVNVEDQNPIEVTIKNKKYTVVKNATLLTPPNTFIESKVTIDETEIPAFKNEVANITLVGLKDEEGKISLFIYKDGEYFNYNEIKSNSYSLIPTKFDKELDLIKTTVNLNNEEIEAYKYNEKTNYVIINATNLETGKTGLYLIDPSNNSAIAFDETLLEKEAIVNDNTLENYTYIIIAFAGALFLMLIVLISLLRNLKKKQEKINKFVQKQEAKIEATRKLNDVVEEVKKIAEEEKEQPKEDKKTKKKNQKKEKQEKIKVEEIQVDEKTKEIKKILDDNEEVFDLFEDEKKKKKKK